MLTSRARGKKKTSLQGELNALRKRTVALVQTSGIAATEKFKAIVLSKWVAQNPGLNPQEEGYAVKSVALPGGHGTQQCVMMRVEAEGEFDVELNCSLQSLFTEEHANADLAVRDGELDQTQKELSKKINSLADIGEAKDLAAYEQLHKKPEVREPHSRRRRTEGSVAHLDISDEDKDVESVEETDEDDDALPSQLSCQILKFFILCFCLPLACRRHVQSLDTMGRHGALAEIFECAALYWFLRTVRIINLKLLKFACYRQ